MAPANASIHSRTAFEVGIPSSAMLLRMSHASRASADCPSACAKVEASDVLTFRGGSFCDATDIAHSSAKHSHDEHTKNFTLGLRAARELRQ